MAILFLLTATTILLGVRGRSHRFEREFTDAIAAAFAMPTELAAPAPRWTTMPADTDAKCSVLGGLLGYCVRVHCAVSNEGTRGGTAVIVATLDHPRRRLTRSARVYLAPGQKERVTFAFREAAPGFRVRAACNIGGGGP
jgi:hypothetical protein